MAKKKTEPCGKECTVADSEDYDCVLVATCTLPKGHKGPHRGPFEEDSSAYAEWTVDLDAEKAAADQALMEDAREARGETRRLEKWAEDYRNEVLAVQEKFADYEARIVRLELEVNRLVSSAVATGIITAADWKKKGLI